MVEIEKGVPIAKAKTGRATKWPFDKMEIGDSFFTAEKVSGAMYAWNNKHRNSRFNSRKVEGGTRVWRIA